MPTARPEWGVSSASREGVPVEVMGMPEVGEGRIPDEDGVGEEDVEVLERGVERRRKDMVWMVWWEVWCGVVGKKKGGWLRWWVAYFSDPGCVFFSTLVRI